MNRALSLLAALVLGLGFTAPAGAQTAGPSFEDSGPDQGDFEHEAPREIFIQFSESLGPSSSTQVYDECGRRLDDGAAEIRGDTLWAQLVLRPAGRYLVVYSASAEGPEAGDDRRVLHVQGPFRSLVRRGAGRRAGRTWGPWEWAGRRAGRTWGPWEWAG